jgi:hypothetical protein
MYDNSSSAGTAGTAAILASTGTDFGLYLSAALALVAIGFFLLGLRQRTRARARQES